MKQSFLGQVGFSAQPVCQRCPRSMFCARIDEQLHQAVNANHPVWKVERLRLLESIKQELKNLGFAYPVGLSFCELAEMPYQDLLAFMQDLNKIS